MRHLLSTFKTLAQEEAMLSTWKTEKVYLLVSNSTRHPIVTTQPISQPYFIQHSKFHLVISIYIESTLFQFPQILESRISPPIFVDSRKTARDNIKMRKQTKLIFSLFSPDILEKAYIKRDSKVKVCGQPLEEISNDIEGLIQYFTAANIRNKVKHPLFLGIRFNGCIKLYVSDQISTGYDERVVEEFQWSLMGEKKFLIIAVESNNKLSQSQAMQKKIRDILEPLESECLEIIIDPIQIPKGYRKLTNMPQLSTSYKYMYPKLLKKKYESENGVDNMKSSVDLDEGNLSTISKVIVLQGCTQKYPSLVEKYYH